MTVGLYNNRTYRPTLKIEQKDKLQRLTSLKCIFKKNVIYRTATSQDSWQSDRLWLLDGETLKNTINTS